MLEAFVQGLQTIFSPATFLPILVGTIVAVFLGILPGINASFAIIVLLPFILGMNPDIILPLMVTFMSVGNTGGSISTILLGVPGDTGNAAIVLDGYPMQKKGQGARGIGAALTACTSGGILSVFMALALVPILLPMIYRFRAPEMFLMIMIGIAFLALLTKRSRKKGLIATALGLLISTIGFQAKTGAARFTFGSLYLYDGIGIVVVMFGIFVVPILVEMGTMTKPLVPPGGALTSKSYRQMLEGARDVVRHFWLWFRSTVIGYIVGIIPGIGGQVGMWVAYAQAKQTSKDPESFGTGRVEGVIAPASANNAKTAGDLLTTLAFGIPGSGVMVLMMAAMVMVGIQPGPQMLTDHLGLSFTLVMAVALANAIAGTLCFALAPYLLKVTTVHPSFLFCSIAPLVLLSVYTHNEVALDMPVLMIMGIVGMLMRKFDYPAPPLMLGFVLGKMFEYYLWQSLTIFGPTFLVSSPIAIVLLIVVLCTFNIDSLQKLRDRFRKPPAASTTGA
ncbi:MAG TPA: tripartite tricarboxylate transporter permease [Anaerolineae bacterium]|nr:tripartite tricarboxylate transporter permease [Anaerolineae bacterium]HPL28049.1 tripartite tricarboxylate transporter permease [Anaerolineae bacterium]